MKKGGLVQNIKKHPMLYVMVLPGAAYFLLFKYVPLLGSVIAFQEYQIFNGISGSPWVGLANFRYIFGYPDFYRILKNTAIIGGAQILVGFPAPVILALLLNEVQARWYKKSLQTVYYLPHFLSWAVLGIIIFDLFALNGPVNAFRAMLGAEPVLFMQKTDYFRPIVVASSVWKEMGWGAIVYLAAIAGISPDLYEASVVEGAGRFKQLLYITLPMLAPTVIVMFLLKIGNFLNLGFEQLYVLMTPVTNSVGDILDTYVYRYGIRDGKYSLTTTIGLFKSTFGFILLVCCNFLSKKSTGRGLF